MPRKFQKRDVFLAPVIEHANRAELFVADTYEFASRSAELPVKRLYPPRRRVEMLLEKFFENIHQDAEPSVKIEWLRASVVIPNQAAFWADWMRDLLLSLLWPSAGE
jgi:hypothetical protein